MNLNDAQTCDGHETMRENGQLNCVQLRPDLPPQVVANLDSDVALTSDLEFAVWFNQNRAQLIHDDAGPGRSVAYN